MSDIREQDIILIEKVFADVAGLESKAHKNVLGDKWKFINAVADQIIPLVRAECQKEIAEYIKSLGMVMNIYQTMIYIVHSWDVEGIESGTFREYTQ